MRIFSMPTIRPGTGSLPSSSSQSSGQDTNLRQLNRTITKENVSEIIYQEGVLEVFLVQGFLSRAEGERQE